jgi:uncharacterized membrane protein YcaP (DUF421 family)
MNPQEIHLWDWKRMLLGQAPPIFLLEVFLRSLIIYIALLVAIRLLGKRMSGQLSISEMAVMVTLGAIVAVPMHMPDRGLLQAILILAGAVAFQRGITFWALRNQRMEELFYGTETLLVKDGIMQLDALSRTRISRHQLFAELRSKEVYNLGRVQRLYLEASGAFSLFEFEKQQPGLPLFPPGDPKLLRLLQPGPDAAKACCNCGTVEAAELVACTYCAAKDWSPTSLD